MLGMLSSGYHEGTVMPYKFEIEYEGTVIPFGNGSYDEQYGHFIFSITCSVKNKEYVDQYVQQHLGRKSQSGCRITLTLIPSDGLIFYVSGDSTFSTAWKIWNVAKRL